MAGDSPAAVLATAEGQYIGHAAVHPLFVREAGTGPEFKWDRASVIEADQPASLVSGNSGPFGIGGQTLTIAVNGTADPQAIPSRSARAGVFISGSYPALNGPNEKIRVVVDGGAEEEIEIGKNLTNYDTIAAVIQTEIRAEVPNGTNVTCEWNTSEFPFRFIVTSGTTGANSYVNMRKGGDDCAYLLKLDTVEGGYRDDGLAANYYYATEVPDLLSGLGSTFVTALIGGKIYIETTEFGATKSLQVTAGGANVAFDFSTTIAYGATSVGASNMNVDGSSTPRRFELRAGDKTFSASKMIVMLRNDDSLLKTFGGLSQLTNGLKVEIRCMDGDLHEWFVAMTNSELIAWADDGQLLDDAYNGDGKDLVVAKFDLSPPLMLRGGTLDAIRFTVQDDLTDLDLLKAYLFGRLYEVA